MKECLTLLNIAPLLSGHEAEVADDILRMYETGVITETAFIMSLVPEGDPPVDKAKLLGDLFLAHREALGNTDMPVGILIQSSIGHGWAPSTPAPFPKLLTGNGKSPYKFCPLGEDFEAYIFDTVSRLARLKPDFFMLDDDTRFLTGVNGCFCPLHIAEFNREKGSDFDFQTLLRAVENDRKTAAEYDDFLKRTMVRHARNIRRAIDSVSPELACSFCLCAQDVRHAPEMAESLAAPGQELTIRINNGLYLRESMRDLPAWLWQTEWQLRSLGPEVRVLTEPDTCPHNNYSTSAAMVHFHMTNALLAGCKGGKLWITRTAAPEFASGARYRKVLSQNRGFYDRIVRLEPEWRGVISPVPSPEFVNFPQWKWSGAVPGIPPEKMYEVQNFNWFSQVFGKMGYPVRCAVPEKLRAGEAVALTGVDCGFLSDAELRHMFRNCNVLLDGPAANALVRRGFAAETGIAGVEAISGRSVAMELFPDGRAVYGQTLMYRLAADPACEVLSELWHKDSRFAEEKSFIAPGAVRFVNRHGRTVVTAACSVQKLDHAAFGMLNETRKAVLREWLEMLAPLPWYIPGDDEVLFRCGVSGEYDILALTDLSHDDMPELPLAGSAAERAELVERLQADGSWAPCRFSKNGSGITVHHCCRPLQTEVLRVRVKKTS